MTAITTTVADQVIALAEQLAGVEAHRDSRLLEDLDLDSLDRIQLAIKIEGHFNIDIPDAVVDDKRLGVMSGLIDYVEQQVALRRPGAEL